LTPHLLRLPDAIFAMLLGSTMKIDPEARSSMWEDLQRGRRTEIDYLQGVITGIADRHGLQVLAEADPGPDTTLKTGSVPSDPDRDEPVSFKLFSSMIFWTRWSVC